MAFLIVAGVTVPVEPGGGERGIVEIGDRGRAFDGSMLASIRARKRVWNVTTAPMSSTDMGTLYTALLAATVSCSGDWMGGSVTCFPEITGGPPVKTAAGHREVLSFILHES
jgi:hypothetical protein